MSRPKPLGRTATTAVAVIALVAGAFGVRSLSTAAAPDFVLIPRSELAALPTTGAAWSNLKTWADKTTNPNLSDQNNQGDVVTFAEALVYARTGDASYRDQAIAHLKAAKGTELAGDSLGTARGVAPLALAADLVGYRDASWSSWLAALRTWPNPDRALSIDVMAEQRPNNFGTHAGAARVAIDLYLGDAADLNRQATVFQGWLGDRSRYAGFKYGDLSWQADPSKPVGVNPKGAMKSGSNVDGILPDDMRRGGSCCTPKADGISYTYEALQGTLLEAYLLDRAGYGVLGWSDQAVLRAFTRAYAIAKPTGDDDWQPWVIWRLYGTNFTRVSPTQPGKATGFWDWLFSGPRPAPSSSASASTQPSSSVTPTSSVAPSLVPSMSSTPSMQPSVCP